MRSRPRFGVGLGKVAQPLRVAVDAAARVSPPIDITRGAAGAGAGRRGARARAALRRGRRAQLIVLLPVFDRSLSRPTPLTAVTAKYQVPATRLLTT